MSYKGKGMWMPKQKSGDNWAVTYSINMISSGVRIKSGTKKFRIRQNALDWIREVKALTVEANQVKEPVFSQFKHSTPYRV